MCLRGVQRARQAERQESFSELLPAWRSASKALEDADLAGDILVFAAIARSIRPGIVLRIVSPIRWPLAAAWRRRATYPTSLACGLPLGLSDRSGGRPQRSEDGRSAGERRRRSRRLNQ